MKLLNIKFLFVNSRYDTGRDGFLCLTELKYMMEKLGAPQTHLGLKAMIQEVDEDNDGQISFREFLLIFRFLHSSQIKFGDFVFYIQIKLITGKLELAN